MIGVLPSEGADPIPTTESSPLTSIEVEPKPGADPIPVGKIPDGATQIAKSLAISTGTGTIHEVTAGKTLYLSLAVATTYNYSGGVADTVMKVTNAADADQFLFARHRTQDDVGLSTPMPFSPPLELPAGWKIKLYSSVADGRILGFIHGYEN